MEVFTLVIVLVLTLLVFLKLRSKRHKNFPPGPRGYPVIGNLLSILNRRPYEAMHKWAETYGSVTGLHFGSDSQPVIILNDWEAIKEALIRQGDNFAGRYNNQLSLDYSSGGLGLLQAEGAKWKEQRRFFLTSLRDFGFGKKTMESVIMSGVDEIMLKINKLGGKETNTQNLFQITMVNIIWKIIASGDFDAGMTEEEVLNLLKTIKDSNEAAGKLYLACHFPLIYNSFLLKSARNGFFAAIENSKAPLRKIIQEHKTKFDPDHQNDFIDLYLNEIRLRKETGETDTSFTEDQLLTLIWDVFFAANDTTSATLGWMLIYLSKHKNVQEKLQEEIDQILGSNTVSIEHKPQFVYVEAALSEVHRHASIAPLAVPHRNIHETQLLGYTIPANTMVMPNLYSVHYSPTLWDNPEEFRPERFIKDGRLVKPEYLVPFSCGKRACPGEALARHELFLFIVSILQKYSMGFSPDNPDPDLQDKTFAGIIFPPEHSIVFTKRQK